MKSLVTCLLAVASLFLSLRPAVADDLKPTKAEVESFRLSMDKVKSTMTAFTNVIDVVANNPKLVAAWKEEAKKDREEGSNEFTVVTSRLSKSDSRVAEGFSKAGITSKEAGMTLETIMGALIGLAVANNADAKKMDLPKGTVRDNIVFVQDHKDEIMQEFGRLQSLREKYPNLKLDKDDDN